MGDNGDAHGPIREPYLDEEPLIAKTQCKSSPTRTDTAAGASGSVSGPCGVSEGSGHRHPSKTAPEVRILVSRNRDQGFDQDKGWRWPDPSLTQQGPGTDPQASAAVSVRVGGGLRCVFAITGSSSR